MSNPTNNFSFDLDPYDRLAQMYGVGLFDLLPLPASWANYVRAQYAPDPSPSSAPVSNTPGFDKSPMFARVGTTTPGFRPLPMAQIGDTPGFDKSPAAGASAVIPSFDPNVPSPSPSWGDYARAQYVPDPLLEAQTSNVPGFRKSPAVLEALAADDPRPPGFYRSPALLRASAMVPSFDSNPTPAVNPQGMLFGRPDTSSLPLPPLPPPWLGVTPVSFRPPPSPLTTGGSTSSDQPLPVTPVNSPPTDIPNVTPAPATELEPPSTVGRRGMAPPVEPPSNSSELEQEFEKWPGQIVRLPNGSPVLDPTSPTGYLMSPFSDLSDVAAAGRRLSSDVLDRILSLSDPREIEKYVTEYLLKYVGQGGTFDYQRRAYPYGKDGLTQLRQFRNVANFNVGLIAQQASIPLVVVLWKAGGYAANKSSNYRPDQPFGLDPQTKEWIERGYHYGTRGMFDSPPRP